MIWARNKSIIFHYKSIKVSVLCDLNSEKSFCYSLIWKELSENVSVTWYKLWKSVQYCLPISLWECKYCLTMIWNLEQFVVLFASYSLKMSVLFDVSSRNVYCLPVTLWECQYCLISKKVSAMFDVNSENVFTLVW